MNMDECQIMVIEKMIQNRATRWQPWSWNNIPGLIFFITKNKNLWKEKEVHDKVLLMAEIRLTSWGW